MIIDIHTHVFPAQIAAKTLDKLASVACIDPNTDGTVEGLMQSMKVNNVRYCITLPAVTNPEKVVKINDGLIAGLEESVKGGILPFAGMHPLFEGYKEEMKRLARAGIKGIKLHPAYQNMDFDAPEMMRVVDAASNEGLLTLIHGGIDIGLYDRNCASVDHILHVVDTVHPEGLIIAHMGGWGDWDRVESDLAGADVYLDTSFSIGEIRRYKDVPPSPYSHCILSDDQFVRIVKKHGTHRILFGTDSPWQDQGDYIARIRGMALSESEIQAILYDNAASLLHV